MLNADTLQEAIAHALPGAKVVVRDTTGTNDHFEASVVWSGFAGKTLVQQHQMVMAPLSEALKGPLHALAIKTSIPK